MKILLAAAEVNPFAKTGGLADVTEALPIEWDNLGHEAIVVMPKHKIINTNMHKFQRTDMSLEIKMGFSIEKCGVWQGKFPNSNAKVYLIEHDDYFHRDGIYGDPHEYFDNDRRFIFFSRSVFELAKELKFKPDILHAHDYHTAFCMPFLSSIYRKEEFFKKTAGVFTIHNLAYQGKYNPYRAMDFSSFGMKEFYPNSWFEHDGLVNSLKIGILFADKVTTVSPNYAQEIRMPYYSESLQDVLNEKGADLIGVLNGVFYEEWSPEKDEFIYNNYTPDKLEIKKQNKYEFLKGEGLREDDDFDIPLFGMVTRLTEQKGIDILKEKLEFYIENKKIRFAIIGSGEQQYMDYFQYLKWKYPKQAFVNIGYDNIHAHRIIACSDFLMVPSRFEPCGLTQMYALKYATIPLVRETGGLADTVEEYLPETQKGTGFVFQNYDKDDLFYAVDRSLSLYKDKRHWDKIRANATKKDFSSERSAKEYLQVFGWALEKVAMIKK